MRFIKFCRGEHNIKTGCPTIQLGTFQYYRELAPSFSIADGNEGQIAYRAEPSEESPLFLTPEQWNAISGGVVQISRQGQPGSPRWPGPVSFSMDGGNMEFMNDGRIRYHGNLGIMHTYPNAYIYCITAIGDDEPIPNPADVDLSYDSFYEIKGESLGQFVKILGHLLHHSLTYQDILFDRLHEPAPLSIPSQDTRVTWNQGPVSYVESRTTLLNSAEDFEVNSLQNLYQRALFEKAIEYQGDKEFRIVFFVQHPRLGVLTAQKAPKILTVNQLGETLS